MPFTPITGPVKPIGRPAMRAVSLSGGEIRMIITIPSALFAKAKWFEVPPRVLVSVGDGAHRGQLMLGETDDATLGIKVALMKKTAMIRLPRQDWMPSIAFEATDIDIRWADKAAFITMPEWAYDAERQKAVAKARDTNAAQAAAARTRGL